MKHATIIAAALLSGCAMFSGSYDSTTWKQVAQPLPMVWQKVDESELMSRCSFKYVRGQAGCIFRLNDGPNGPYCLVISSVTLEVAQRTFMYSPTGAIRTLNGKPETLADHEKQHCNGYDHLEAK